ncbi:MAG: hypothetical protein QOK44_3416, partial [Betaproteobacteria bacterium]|nr:hypothetical protein [Betaproteobacteria bacterium]
CYLLGSACDPAQFVFWDMDHPTPRVQAILGNQFFAAVVPEPRTIELIALGMFILLSARRRTLLSAASHS